MSLLTRLPPPVPQSGTLHSARCWRSTSARCCASSERHVRVGVPECSPHFQCANRLHSPNCLPGLSHVTQVSALLLTPAASLACHHSGAFLHRGRFFGNWSFWIGSYLPTTQHQVSACATLSLGPFAKLWPGMHHLRSGPFGSRNEILQSLSEQTRGQGCVPSIRSQQLTSGSPARVFRLGTVGTLSLQTSVDRFRSSFGLCPHYAHMGRRGKRSGRRRRPRDTAREAQRPPKRHRGPAAAGAAEEAIEEVDSHSSERSDDDDIGAPRPLTVFSVEVTGRTAATGSTDHRIRDDVEDARGFSEHDLRVERSPEEFLAIAASLGREYAIPAAPQGGHRVDSVSGRSLPHTAASSARDMPAPIILACEFTSHSAPSTAPGHSDEKSCRSTALACRCVASSTETSRAFDSLSFEFGTGCGTVDKTGHLSTGAQRNTLFRSRSPLKPPWRQLGLETVCNQEGPRSWKFTLIR